MNAIRTTPGATSLFAASILGRMPSAMLTIALLVHATHLTGSYAEAGLTTGIYAVALAVGGPVLGGLIDRRGQTRILVPSAVAAAALLAAIACLPTDVPLALLLALAAGAGLVLPPIAAAMRALLGELVGPDAAPAAYAVDATALELTWLVGPPLAIGLGRAASTGAALAAVAALVLGGTLAFAAHPASRASRPAHAHHDRSSALRSAGLRTLIVVLISFGFVMGAAEVGVTAATQAAGQPGAAGPLFALWGLGSLIGGALVMRRGGGVRASGPFALLFGALALGHGALVLGAASPLVLAGLLVLAGATIAPTNASASAIVQATSRDGSQTEAFAWIATAASIGAAGGVSIAGAAVQAGGAASAFLVAGAAGAIGVTAILAGAATLKPSRGRPLAVACEPA